MVGVGGEEPAAGGATRVSIRDDMIRLGQFLQLAGVVDGGSEAKQLLADAEVRVNGEPEPRRGRQLHPGDLVEVDGLRLQVVSRPG